MPHIDRRSLLAAAAGFAALPPSIARAVAIPADRRSGTIADVEHVVILMQENRAFDHYFGALPGVRGFNDPYPAPVAPAADGAPRDVMLQLGQGKAGAPRLVAPFPLKTRETFAHMRVEGTPHSWPDAQDAWDEGRMGRWATAKGLHSMGYFEREDIPFQYALADAFTLCDAYHCSIQSSTNPNRLFLWSATNDPLGQNGGPALANSHDVRGNGAPYTWTTYPERLQAAGVRWRVYQDMADNFTDNPLIGFKAFQDSMDGKPGSDPELARRGLTTAALDVLRADVLAGKLPHVSWVVATAAGSEHPDASSPAQGAAYTAEVIDALTADPKVWARTVLLVMFDENDGFFDHVPPPSPPSRDADAPGGWAGASTVDTTGEYHRLRSPDDKKPDRADLLGRPYGLGARVPFYAISPWSRGGRVNSEVFDHTSVIRFLETRFGVKETNISAWRRAVCGDLTSLFDFAAPNVATVSLPDVAADAARAKALPGMTMPPIPAGRRAATVASVERPACPSPYHLDLRWSFPADEIALEFINLGQRGAVFHIYDRLRLDRAPRRYTVEGGKRLTGAWALEGGRYDLQIMGPDGFHRRLAGNRKTDDLAIDVQLFGPSTAVADAALMLSAQGAGRLPARSTRGDRPVSLRAGRAGPQQMRVEASAQGRYDVTVLMGDGGFIRQFAGRVPRLKS